MRDKEKPLDYAEKLKLVRALYGLSQDEMATIAGMTRVHLAMVEIGKKALPKKRAREIGNALWFDADWLLDDHLQPLMEYHLLVADLPSRRLSALPRNILERRMNDVYTAMKSLLPSFFKENRPEGCWIFSLTDGEKIFVITFNGDQGMLLRVCGDKQLAAIVEDVIEKVLTEHDESKEQNVENKTNVQIVQKEADRDTFDKIDADNPAEVLKLLEGLSLPQEARSQFKLAVENLNQRAAAQTVREMDIKNRSDLIRRICNDMVENEIRTQEIVEKLIELKHSELISCDQSHTSHN